MYILLGTQFKSFTQPLIILFTVPFAFIGAMLGLLVNGTPFGIVTLFGMVALAVPIAIAGYICLFVGVFIAMMWIYIAIASLYHAVSLEKR